MITKKVPMNNPRKSSFSGLTKYLVDDQGKAERVGDVFITNCHSTDPKWAAIEVEATQALNTRAKSDKTYHLLVSFREGEELDNSQLKDIESQLAKALGFEEHQRITVVHRDTDNLHMHMAINKIHPVTHTLHEPFRDHRTRDELCIKIEEQYGLEKDNHKSRKTIGQSKADDMENMAGVESLLTGVKKLPIHQVKSWSELHNLLHENGLKIIKKGNGVVFVNSEGTAVKGSSVDRNFSLKNLEDKLGGFEDVETPYQLKSYVTKPLDSSSESQKLYKSYQEERKSLFLGRSSILNKLSKEQIEAIEKLKLSAKLKRETLKFAGRGILKSIALKHISKKLIRDIKNVSDDYAEKRKNVYSATKILSWRHWLSKEAEKGNTEALNILRKRNAPITLKGNVISPISNSVFIPTSIQPDIPISHVTSSGTVIYKLPSTVIRESANSLKITSVKASDETAIVLKLALKKFGKNLNVNGGNTFKTDIARTAALYKLNVNFTDPNLNHLKKIFELNPTEKVQYDEIRRPERTRRNVSGIRRARNQRNNGRFQQTPISRGNPHREYDNERLKQSNFGRIGKFPPPESQNGLRGLSKLGMVRISNRTEVLLQSNVPHNVVKQGTATDRAVRRNLSRSGLNDSQYNVSEVSKAVDKLVNERNTKHGYIDDISKHRAFSKSDSGTYKYAGYRNIDGHLLVLLKGVDEVLVVESDTKTVNRLRKARKGCELTITDTRKIQLLNRGISR